MLQFDSDQLDQQFDALRIGETLGTLAAQNIIARIWTRDHTVWKSEDREISNRLGWLHSPDEMLSHLAGLERFAQQLRTEGFTHAVLLGMGGSSLAPEMFRKVFGVRPGFLELLVLDSTDPGAVLEVERAVDLERTLFLVSTKSGSTVETLSAFKYFYNQVATVAGNGKGIGDHFVAITDPGSPLAELATRYQFRATFLNNPDIGGRYSALSYFGLLPAALIGLDLAQLVARGKEMAVACGAQVPPTKNPGAQLGAIIGRAALAGRDKLTFVLSPSLASFGDWVEQLIAESTGKEGKGILPVVGEPLGDARLYAAHDRLFVQITLAGEPAEDAALAQLERAGQPVVRIALRDHYDVGAQFFLWEMATAVAGHLLGVNPFDQPNVEAAKALARKVVAEYAARGSIPSDPPVLVEDGVALYMPAAQQIGAAHLADAIGAFLAQARPGDYVALHAYLQPTPATYAQLQALRLKLRDCLCLATTLGYGPRFLHSTGQLHKGDAGKGLFIQLTADSAIDVPIPDEAGQPEASLSFGVLKMAQALGDYQALQAAGRRVMRLHLQDVAKGLDHLTRRL